MPGQIISIPFLSQVEDIDRWSVVYKNTKIKSDTTFSYSNSNKVNHSNHYNNHNYNYNNTHQNGKGNNGHFKRMNNNMNRNYINKTNYENYNKNYDYLKYNNSTKNSNNSSGYLYGNQMSNMSPSNSNINSNFSKVQNEYPMSNPSDGNMVPNPAIAEQLKLTYPQLYQNTQPKLYSSNTGLDQTNFALNQVTNDLSGLQLPDSERYLSGQNGIGNSGFMGHQRLLNTSSSNDLNLIMNNSQDGDQPALNMASFKSYIPSQLLDSTNTPYPGGNTSTTIMDEVLNTSNSLINRNNISSIQTALGNNHSYKSLTPTPNPALNFSTSGKAQNLNSIMLNSPSTLSNHTSTVDLSVTANESNSQPNLSSLGWGSNQMDIQSSIPGRSSMDASNGSNSDRFGIWNNDMSVWR